MAEKIRYEKKKTRLTEKYQQPPESLIRIFMLLLYVFFEEGGFCCTISIKDKGAQEVDSIFGELLPEIQASWLNRYACGADGGWLNRSVISDEELPDLIRLVGVKVKPKKIGGKNA